ncbi:MAG: mechanosensitive ion channel family protein, partial [Candidatus Omnitrophica bacterium]|nr:mechanosensitive ion channel family protein [Candidatus Omnitrophota bacterium]
MKELVIFGIEIPSSIFIPVLYSLWVTIFLIAKRIFFVNVRRFAKSTALKADDVLLNALDLPVTLLIFVSGVTVLENVFH